MNQKIVAITLLLMLSGSMQVATANTVPWPNLPLTQVQLTAEDGTTSYFISTLNGVPAGFNVTNAAYLGWCVDRSIIMSRSVPHNVSLYSSLTPPVKVSSINWIAINYILNHKQGNMMDIQEAIWHFTDAFSPISATAQLMVDDANANQSFDPSTGAVLAVICLPQNDVHAQRSIIECTHSVEVYNGESGNYSGTSSHETDSSMEGYVTAILAADHASVPTDVDTHGIGKKGRTSNGVFALIHKNPYICFL